MRAILLLVSCLLTINSKVACDNDEKLARTADIITKASIWNHDDDSWAVFDNGMITSLKNVMEFDEEPTKKHFMIFTAIECKFAFYVTNHLLMIIDTLMACQAKGVVFLLTESSLQNCVETVILYTDQLKNKISYAIDILLNYTIIASSTRHDYEPLFLKALLSLDFFIRICNELLKQNEKVTKYQEDFMIDLPDNEYAKAKQNLLIDINVLLRELFQFKYAIEHFTIISCPTPVIYRKNIKKPKKALKDLLENNSASFMDIMNRIISAGVQIVHPYKSEKTLLADIHDPQQNIVAFKEISGSTVKWDTTNEPFTVSAVFENVTVTYDLHIIFRYLKIVLNTIMKLVYQKTLRHLAGNEGKLDFDKFDNICALLKNNHFPKQLIDHFELLTKLKPNDENSHYTYLQVKQIIENNDKSLENVVSVPSNGIDLTQFVDEILNNCNSFLSFNLVFPVLKEEFDMYNVPSTAVNEVQHFRSQVGKKYNQNPTCAPIKSIYEISLYVKWLVKKCEGLFTNGQHADCMTELADSFKLVEKYVLTMNSKWIESEKNNQHFVRLTHEMVHVLQNAKYLSITSNFTRASNIVLHLLDSYALHNCDPLSFNYSLLSHIEFTDIKSLSTYQETKTIKMVFGSKKMFNIFPRTNCENNDLKFTFGALIDFIYENTFGSIISNHVKFYWKGAAMRIREIYLHALKNLTNSRIFFKFRDIVYKFLLATVSFLTFDYISLCAHMSNTWCPKCNLPETFVDVQNTFFERVVFPEEYQSFINDIRLYRNCEVVSSPKCADKLKRSIMKYRIENKLDEFGVVDFHKNLIIYQNTLEKNMPINMFYTDDQMISELKKIFKTIAPTVNC